MMKQTVKRIVSLGNQISVKEETVEARGTLDFINILNSYPEFVAGKEAFVKKKRGRPAKNPAPVEIDYLVFLVESLYESKGLPYTYDDRRNLKTLLVRAADGADFFDPIRSTHWLDLLSALDFNLSLFSRSEDASFSEFYNNYITFYSKLNNKKLVPFYSRWINEIAAMYTIYINGVFRDYEDIKNMLWDALKEGREKEKQSRASWQETDTIRDYLMVNIFMAYGKQKDEVLGRLCQYISEHPDEFVYVSGSLRSRYRRYYCAIREMLAWIKAQNMLSFGNDDLISLFLEGDLDYDLKDSRIRELETLLVKKLLEMSKKQENVELTSEEQEKIMAFFVQEKAIFDERTGTEIVCELNGYPFERKRTIEEVVDCVVKLLRFFIMLIHIAQGQSDDNNNYEIPSVEEEIFRINQVMRGMGLLPLPKKTASSYNESTLLDLCVVMCIEESFYEDD